MSAYLAHVLFQSSQWFGVKVCEPVFDPFLKYGEWSHFGYHNKISLSLSPSQLDPLYNTHFDRQFGSRYIPVGLQEHTSLKLSILHHTVLRREERVKDREERGKKER